HPVGCLAGAARAEAVFSEALRRFRSLSAVLDGVRGSGSVLASCQAGSDRDIARPAVDFAVSRCRIVGGAMAAQSRARGQLTNSAKDSRRFDADQRHVRACAIGHSLASGTNGSRVAPASLLAPWSFHPLLCRTPGN